MKAPKPIKKVIGVDLGLTNIAATSDGALVAPPKALRHSLERLQREQRKLSRRKRGSWNRLRQRFKVARINRTIARQRTDFLHKLSRKLVDENDGIVFEDLQVQNMQQNRHLSLSIADAGWSELVRMTTYKAEGAGGRVVLVSPAGTSQDCSACGAKVPKDLSERTHRCVCGLVLDRDVNAARNILKLGLGELHGWTPSGRKRVRATATGGTPGSHACGDWSSTAARAAASPVVEAGRRHPL